MDRLLDASEVAERLAVPVSWVRQESREGRIPHVRLGRYVRFSEDEVLAWVDSLKSGGGSAYRKHVPTRGGRPC